MGLSKQILLGKLMASSFKYVIKACTKTETSEKKPPKESY